MKAPAGKVPDNKSQAVANQPVKQQGQDGALSEAPMQGTLQEAANNSAQVQQLKAYQAMANSRATPIVQPKASNGNLPGPLQSGIESLSGYSMNDVQVHYNSDKPAQLNALAFAQGTDIHIASGQEKHLPHEAWHVVQQKQGRVQPTMQLKGEIPVNDDQGLEAEADTMGAKALTVSADNTQQEDLSTVTTGGLPAVQRVRGGIEYTEQGNTTLKQWQPSAIANLAAHNVAPAVVAIGDTNVTFYAVPNNTYTNAAADNEDHIALQTGGQVRLENDVSSAEWIVERHDQEYTKENFVTQLGLDWVIIRDRRNALRAAVAAQQAAHPAGTQIVFRRGNQGANLTQATAERVFGYTPLGDIGSVQITLGYKGGDTMKNIALSNVSTYMAGTVDDSATRRERVGGTKTLTWLAEAPGTANQWMNAKSLHADLKADMTAVEPGLFSDVFSTAELATVQLMVLMDTMNRRATNDAGGGGQSSGKNIQRFFPKSVRDSYVREMLGPNVTAGRMAAIRVNLTAAIAASVAKFYAALDPLRLPVGAFREAFVRQNGAHEPNSAGLQHNIATTAGAIKAGHENNLKILILGTQANFVTTAQDIIKAYTDTSANSQEQHRGNNVANGFEYMVSGKAPHVVARGNGAVFEDRAEVLVAGAALGAWGADNPLKVAVLSLLRGTT